MNYSHEIIMPNEDIPFKMFLFEGKDGHYMRSKHWHRSVEIFALFEGELEFFINEKPYLLRPGDFMLVNSNEVHSVLSPKPNKTIVLQIPLSTFEKHYTEDRFIYFTHSSRIQDDEVMQLIGDMYATYNNKKIGYELKVQSQFYMLVYLLVSKYRKTDIDEEVVRKKRGLDKLSLITSYIKDNYDSDITLENLAHTFSYSPAYLSRMFQKYADTNFKTYLTNIRLDRAYRDLVNTEASVGTISIQNGFPNQKAFAKAFSEKYGKTPGEFRKVQQKDNSLSES